MLAPRASAQQRRRPCVAITRAYRIHHKEDSAVGVVQGIAPFVEQGHEAGAVREPPLENLPRCGGHLGAQLSNGRSLLAEMRHEVLGEQ